MNLLVNWLNIIGYIVALLMIVIAVVNVADESICVMPWFRLLVGGLLLGAGGFIGFFFYKTWK